MDIIHTITDMIQTNVTDIFPLDLTVEILSYSDNPIWLLLSCNITGTDHDGYCSGVDADNDDGDDDNEYNRIINISEKSMHFVPVSFTDAYKINNMDDSKRVEYFNTLIADGKYDIKVNHCTPEIGGYGTGYCNVRRDIEIYNIKICGSSFYEHLNAVTNCKWIYIYNIYIYNMDESTFEGITDNIHNGKYTSSNGESYWYCNYNGNYNGKYEKGKLFVLYRM